MLNGCNIKNLLFSSFAEISIFAEMKVALKLSVLFAMLIIRNVKLQNT